MLTEHRWIAKALIQKAVSRTGMLRAYHLAQRVGGRLRNFNPSGRFVEAGLIAADGTGWAPIIPIGLHLLGVRRILSFDLTAHLMPEVTLAALPKINECLPDLSAQSGVPLSVLQDRLAQLLASRDLDALAKKMGFEYHAPLDVTQSAVQPQSVDLVYSNLVFEHVTVEALNAILAYSRRILKPEGIAWHHVDYSDHYAHTFKGLSLINFLRYGERRWNMIGQSDLHYQNRLRKSDYVRAFRATGFEVTHCIDHLGVSEEQARQVPLAEPFTRCELSDLTCTSSRFVLRVA